MAAPVAALFVIQIGDPVQAAAYQAQYPNGVQMSPVSAAVIFNAPIAAQSASVPNVTTIPWQGFNFDQTVAAGIIHNGWTDPFGNVYPDTPFYWVGVFLASIITPPVPAPANPIGVRRFVVGFEMPILGEGQTMSSDRFSRDASRAPDGLGYAYRSDISNIGPTHSLSPTPNFSYERFYVRLRTLPVGGNDMIWSIAGSIEGGGPSLHIDVSPTGQLLVYNQGNGGAPGTLVLTTAALTVGVWTRIDLHFQFVTATIPGIFQMWVNGVSVASLTVTTLGVMNPGGINIGTSGLGHVQSQNSSTLGNTKGTTNNLECDLDDWVNSTFLDVNSGSHIQLVRPNGLDAISSPSWVGDWRQLLPVPADLAAATDAVVSSTALSTLAVTTDYHNTQLGCAAFLVGFRNNSSGAVTCKLGWSIGGAQTLASVNITNATWATGLYTVPGNTIPAISALSLIFQKDAAGGTIDANGLQASAEFLGFFGAEDVVLPSTVVVPPPLRTGIHNAPYASSAWALGLMNVVAPVQIWSGIYTGNNLGQDVITQFPAHWWWVRALTADSAGAWWWSSMVSAQGRLQLAMKPIRMVQALLDAVNVGRMRVAGQDNQANATAVQYQWVAVSDPSMRFLTNGAFLHAAGIASAVNPLIDGGFTPEAVFLAIEQQSGAGTGTFFKGLGHGTFDASPLDAALTANVVSIGAGSLTSKPAAVSASTNSPQTAYSAWRRTDGGSPGDCGGLGTVLIDLVTYTGNGAGGTRNIACALGGRSPLFALITPHNGLSFFRDPSHTGTTSSQSNGTANAATAIVGGDLNQITVGTALNTNNIVYDVFVIAGIAIPGGWSVNPTNPITPVCPTPRPVAGPFPPAPAISPTPLPSPSPTPTPTPTTGGCYPFSVAISDLANRLQDPGNVHWTAAELGRYLVEALRTFNAYTQKYRQQGTFSTTVLAPFYDVPTILPALRGYNVTDQGLVTDIQYALMEPPTPTVWTGTSQFTLNDVTQALQRRLNHFLEETGAVLARQILAVTPAANGRVTLPQNVITIRRLAWVMNDATHTVVPLKREDEWALTNYQRGWVANPTDPSQTWPTGYSAGVEPPLTVQIANNPVGAGWLDILSVVLGPTLNPATGVLVGIPDDWTWVVKFGALADLLGRDGTAYDPQRSAYCEARWKLGVDLATQASVVLAGRVSNVPTRLYGLSEADIYKRTWQTGAGVPGAILTAAQNILAVTPSPDNNGPYTLTLDVVANIPVPVAGGDCINLGIGDEDLDAVLDLAQHLAVFKEGPSQLTASMDLYDRFVKATGTTKQLDQALVPNRGAILQQTVQDVRVVPRESPPEETTS